MSANSNPAAHQQYAVDMDSQDLVPLMDIDTIDRHHGLHNEFNPTQYSFLSSPAVQVPDSLIKENRQQDSFGHEDYFTVVGPSRLSQDPYATYNYYGQQSYCYGQQSNYYGKQPSSSISLRNVNLQNPYAAHNYYGQLPHYGRDYGTHQYSDVGVCNEFMQNWNPFNGYNATVHSGSEYYNRMARSSHTVSGHVSTVVGSSSTSQGPYAAYNYYGQVPYYGTNQFSDVAKCNESVQISNPFDGSNSTVEHASKHFNGAAELSNIVSNSLPKVVQPVKTSNSSRNIHIKSNADVASVNGCGENRAIDENDAALPPEHEFNEIDPTLTPTEQVFANINPKRRSCDNSEMNVQTSDGAAKEYMCIYCKEFYQKIARHLEQVHKDEIDVQKLDGLKKRSKERRQILDILRNRGTFQYNNVEKFNNRQLLPARRPNVKFVRTGKDFIPCPKCLGTYSRRGDHIRKCCKNVFNGKHLGSVMSAAVSKRIHYQASDRLERICQPLRNTAGVLLLKYDWILIAFGNKQCKKYKLKKHEKNIRQKLRMCGRVFSELKLISKEITDFASIYRPSHYEDVLQVARIIGQFDEKTDEFGAPSSALDALLQVKDVGRTLVCEYIKKENHDLQKRTENFLQLLNDDASASIYKSIYDSLNKKKRLRVDHLPSIADIKTMLQYLDAEIQKYSTALAREFSFDEWKSLNQLILTWIVVFNRKRVGDAENILVSEFTAREYVNSDTLDTLTVEDKSAAERYSRMRVNGKKERTVPVLLTPEIVEGITFLLQHRQSAKISPENEFLFAAPSIDTSQTFSACDMVRKYSIECGAKEPATLRGTLLRKHVATHCVSKKYDDIKVGYVAEFLGHHEQVHRNTYRRNPMVDEIVNVSQLLESAKGDDGRDKKNDSNDLTRNERGSGAKNSRKRKNNEVVAEPQKKRRIK